MHAGPYRVQAQAANDRLKEQTAVGAWALGWQPSAPKQDLGVSVHGGAQKASGLREAWQRPCTGCRLCAMPWHSSTVAVWTPLEGLLYPTHQHWIGDILE